MTHELGLQITTDESHQPPPVKSMLHARAPPSSSGGTLRGGVSAGSWASLPLRPEPAGAVGLRRSSATNSPAPEGNDGLQQFSGAVQRIWHRVSNLSYV